MCDFEDFLMSIDKDALGAEFDKIFQQHPTAIIAEFSPENIAAILEAQYSQCIAVSGKVTLAYLKQYHEWLSRQGFSRLFSD